MNKLTYILWRDSESHDGWSDHGHVELNFKTIPACGILIKENEDGIALAVSVDSANERSIGIVEIPKFAIVFRAELPIPERPDA